MRYLTFLAFIGCAFWLVGDSVAQPPQGRGGFDRQQGQAQGGRRGGGMDDIFQMLDRNGDGSISEDEAPQRMQAFFGQLDSDSDGGISKRELMSVFMRRGARGQQGSPRGESGPQGRRGRRPGGGGDNDMGDRPPRGEGGPQGRRGRGPGGGPDGDMGNRPQRGEGGPDGRRGRRPGGGPDGDMGDRPPRGEGGPRGQRAQGMDPSRLLDRMDKNGDGEIGADEAPERMKNRFDQIDADGSGGISADELKAAFEKMRQRMKDGDRGDRRGGGADKKAQKPKRPGGDGQ